MKQVVYELAREGSIGAIVIDEVGFVTESLLAAIIRFMARSDLPVIATCDLNQIKTVFGKHDSRASIYDGVSDIQGRLLELDHIGEMLSDTFGKRTIELQGSHRFKCDKLKDSISEFRTLCREMPAYDAFQTAFRDIHVIEEDAKGSCAELKKWMASKGLSKPPHVFTQYLSTCGEVISEFDHVASMDVGAEICVKHVPPKHSTLMFAAPKDYKKAVTTDPFGQRVLEEHGSCGCYQKVNLRKCASFRIERTYPEWVLLLNTDRAECDFGSNQETPLRNTTLVRKSALDQPCRRSSGPRRRSRERP